MSTDPYAYSDFFETLVRAQADRKQSLEQRGLSVITTSGVLVTLLFGLVTIITQTKDYRLPTSAHGPLGCGLVLFVIAAVLGLLANLPLSYENVDPAFLDKLLDRYKRESRQDATLRVSAFNSRVFKRAKQMNEIKAWLLVSATLSEVVAVLAVAVAVGHVLQSA